MRTRILLHGVVVGAAVIAVSAFAVSGCSMAGPDSSWTGNSGSLVGGVQSDKGTALAGIEVHLWGEIGTEGREIEYHVVTDGDGRYEVNDIELGGAHDFEETYTVYVNRTHDSALRVNSEYGTYVTTVIVQMDGSSCVDIVITEEGPGDPEQYVDD